MGLASSQARLLSITARLTSNEYESQQISNAKMRLATQTQEASEAYIAALNDTTYSFISFDSTGNSVKTPLTVATMYEYADGKNQYILTNSAGKVLLSNKDIQNYENSPTLERFLSKYGINKVFPTVTLEQSWNKLFDENTEGGNLSRFVEDWEKAITEESKSYPTETWKSEKLASQERYFEKLLDYNTIIKQSEEGEDITKDDIFNAQTEMEIEREKFTKLLTYNSALEARVRSKSSNKDTCDGYDAYLTAKAKYQEELTELGLSARNAYQYDDPTKAQWYTNLWYKLNGSSTDNVGAKNYASFTISDGIREAKDGQKIVKDDAALLNSSVWISNALSKGLVNIEQAGYSQDDMTLASNDDPFTFNLHGISWSGKIYSSISDIVEADKDKAVAKAEAEYQRKTAEINAKDEKYQRKLNLLDTEHNAMQTEYESVKSALNKNMERSFKAFQG